jgi:hypothetical protein
MYCSSVFLIELVIGTWIQKVLQEDLQTPLKTTDPWYCFFAIHVGGPSEHNITRVVQCGQRVETQQCRQTGTTGKRKMANKTLPVLSDATEARRNLAMPSGT